MLKIEPTIMKNQRPTMLWRSWSTASLALAAGSGRSLALCRPKVLVSRMPLTLSVSSVIADMSARLFWVSVLIAAADLADAVGQVQEERQHARATAASAASR